MDAFVDGNDLCAGCSNCCRRVEGLLLTDEELERLPRMRPFVTGERDGFHVANMPEGCPYLLPNGWCGTFETRPFDCSLFPAQVGGVRRDGTGNVAVEWRWGEAPECPSREGFVRRGVPAGRIDALERWAAAALGAPSAEAVEDRSGEAFRPRLRRRARRALRRGGLLPAARRLLRRAG